MRGDLRFHPRKLSSREIVVAAFGFAVVEHQEYVFGRAGLPGETVIRPIAEIRNEPPPIPPRGSRSRLIRDRLRLLRRVSVLSDVVIAEGGKDRNRAPREDGFESLDLSVDHATAGALIPICVGEIAGDHDE